MENIVQKFTIKDKIYTVKAFNMFQLANIRQQIVELLKINYKKDIIDLASTINEKDRSKFILDALRSRVCTEEDINSQMVSDFGINLILSVALNESIETIKSLVSTLEDNQVLLDVFNFVLQTKSNEEPEKKVLMSTPN